MDQRSRGAEVSWIEWTLGIVSALTVAAITWIGNVIHRMPIEYMPRDQTNARFQDIERRMHLDLTAQDARTEKRFDSIDGKLDRILERLERKADR